MSALKAHVVNGRIVVDDPVDLPEGTELAVFLYDAEGDDLDEESSEERAEIEAAIDESIAEFEAGKIVDDETIRATIRAHR